MEGLDYDACAQLLAQLDADGGDVITGPSSTTSLSPVDRSSSSPPGLSSATSLSPDSFKYNLLDDTLNNNIHSNLNTWNEGAAFFSAASPYLSNSLSWDVYMPDQPQSQDQDIVSPIQGDYIKTEESSSQGFFNGQTLSPRSSLIDPAAPTALEGTNGVYPYRPSNSDQLFGGYDYSQGERQSSSNDNLGRAVFGQSFVPNGFNAASWQSPQQIQQIQQQKQQQQQQELRRLNQQSLQLQQHHQLQPQHQQSQQQQQQGFSGSMEPVFNKHSQSPTSRQSSSSPSDSTRHESPDDNSQRTKKRKTSGSPEDTTQAATHNAASTSRKQPLKKTAHNMIEKRYRTNLNDKIAALRDSVPSLRVMAGTSRLGDDDEEEDLEGLTPAHKLNKATVLAKATEYIRHLEKRSKKLQEENDQLKNRLSTFEKLATMGGAMAGQATGNGRTATSGPGGGLMSRLMVGSLAGLMVANGLQEQDTTRGLFGFSFPFEFGFSTTEFTGSHYTWLIFKVVLFFTAIAYVCSPGFFDSPKDKTSSARPALTAVPSLASPVEVRRQAWLTAIQTVWVPRHSYVFELAALGLKFLKLSLRQLVGWHGYALITGTTEEQEIARVKAWTIAIDAQLAGGDAEITRSRLLLTLLASLTLPATPSRLMLNALHIQILFWDLRWGFESAVQKLSTYYWNEARRLQAASAEASSADSLPEHLASLLELEPTKVLVGRIIQRAYNLAYNRPTETDDNEGDAESHDEGMNSVVKDFAIRSPLDALAAWYSSFLLRRSSLASLKGKQNGAVPQQVEDDLTTALKIAPPTSGAQLRVLATRSVLLWDKGNKDLATLLKVFKEDFAAAECQRDQSDNAFSWRPAFRMVTVTPDMKIAVRCAMTLMLIHQGTEKGRREGIRLFSDLDWSFGHESTIETTESAATSAKRSFSLEQLGLMGFVVSWKTLTVIAADQRLHDDAHDTVENAAGALRRWSGSNVAKRAGVGKTVRMKLGDFCTSLAKKMAGIEPAEGEDAGYVSGEKDGSTAKSAKSTSAQQPVIAAPQVKLQG